MRNEEWREELMELLWELVRKELYPTPYALRQVGQALLELREIMLMDDLEHTHTKRTIEEIKTWLENAKHGNGYELWKALKEYRELMKSVNKVEKNKKQKTRNRTVK
jgi:putative protein kinase ArgK-like GTPase of G3E family